MPNFSPVPKSNFCDFRWNFGRNAEAKLIDLLFMHGRYSTYEAWPQSITKTSSHVDDDNDRCSADKDVQGMPTQRRFVSLMERNGPALQLSCTHGRIHPQLCARPSMASWRDMGGYVMRCLLVTKLLMRYLFLQREINGYCWVVTASCALICTIRWNPMR